HGTTRGASARRAPGPGTRESAAQEVPRVSGEGGGMPPPPRQRGRVGEGGNPKPTAQSRAARLHARLAGRCESSADTRSMTGHRFGYVVFAAAITLGGPGCGGGENASNSLLKSITNSENPDPDVSRPRDGGRPDGSGGDDGTGGTGAI